MTYFLPTPVTASKISPIFVFAENLRGRRKRGGYRRGHQQAVHRGGQARRPPQESWRLPARGPSRSPVPLREAVLRRRGMFHEEFRRIRLRVTF